MGVGIFPGRWNGKLGVGFRTALPGLPTAQAQIVAGTAAAGSAPLKFSTGVNLAAVEAGAMEYDGTNLFFTPVATRESIFMGTDAGVAPATHVVALTTTIFGANTALLGAPGHWAAVVVGGVTYKIPLYT